ncbi:hypothetical protein D3C85_1214380 [compost metagenome]
MKFRNCAYNEMLAPGQTVKDVGVIVEHMRHAIGGEVETLIRRCEDTRHGVAATQPPLPQLTQLLRRRLAPQTMDEQHRNGTLGRHETTPLSA